MIKPFAVHQAVFMNESSLKSAEEKLKERLPGIFEEEPIKFLPLQSYTFPQGELSNEFLAQAQDTAPTVGQHLGKPIMNM